MKMNPIISIVVILVIMSIVSCLLFPTFNMITSTEAGVTHYAMGDFTFDLPFGIPTIVLDYEFFFIAGLWLITGVLLVTFGKKKKEGI